MKIKALLLDFDGTIVSKDMLSEVIDIVGKKEESEKIDELFQSGELLGLSALVERINLLKNTSVDRIKEKVKEDLSLMDGARELISHCKSNTIITILASGSITPILEVYKDELGIDYIVGSQPEIVDGKIAGISLRSYPDPKEGHFKVVGISTVLKEQNISIENTCAIGDSRGDIPMFEMAQIAMAIHPKGGIGKYADHIISDLHQGLSIIEEENS